MSSAFSAINAAARRLRRPKHHMVLKCKQRAGKVGMECTITEHDFDIPAVCPILLIPIAVGAGVVRDGSPTLDRIDSTKGYVPGNVRCISHAANRKKSDMSIETVHRLLAYMTVSA